MSDILFYAFAAITVFSAFMVVCSRNPVNAALFMIAAFVGAAALFALLEAFFLAAVQVLVYAGAVIVLFLFIIMLLDVERTRALRPALVSLAASAAALGLLVVGVLWLFAWEGAGPLVDSRGSDAPAALARNFGYELFTRYLLPVQVTGFLLLVAMIGVIHISKRPARDTAAESKGEEANP